jgi:hypothetical protein
VKVRQEKSGLLKPIGGYVRLVQQLSIGFRLCRSPRQRADPDDNVVAFLRPPAGTRRVACEVLAALIIDVPKQALPQLRSEVKAALGMPSRPCQRADFSATRPA